MSSLLFGVDYKLETDTRDLGFSYTSAKTNPKRLIKHRLKKSQVRLKKIHALAKISRKARILFSGSGFPAATFGHSACGLTLQELEALEISAANCTGITQPGRCRTFALVLAYGRYGTPYARIIHETITAWFDIVHAYISKGNHLDVI